MKRMRIIGLALVAVFALTAVMASAASAELPEFQQKGKPLTKNLKFTSKSGVSILKTAAGSIECASDTNNGEIDTKVEKDSKHVTVIVKFKKCKSALGECKSGTTKGEIVTNKLVGWLFYINPVTKEVGIWFKALTGNRFAVFTCGTTKIEVESVEKVESGSCLAGRATPVNTESLTGMSEFKEAGGKQEIRKVTYEGKEIECELVTIIGVNKLQSQQINLDEIKYAKAVEIKA
jgi:hypothetical protein